VARLGTGPSLWHIRNRLPAPGRPDRLLIATGLALVLAGLAACGAEEPSSIGTLPPIRTTSTTSTSTTLFDQTIQLYTVKRGENLSLIARSFEVPLQFLIDANEDQIDDPNNVPPGVTLKIPPYRIVDELPTTTTTTEAP